MLNEISVNRCQVEIAADGEAGFALALGGGISLRTDTRRLYVEGREMELKNKKYELLLFFVLHVDIVFSREELYEKI